MRAAPLVVAVCLTAAPLAAQTRGGAPTPTQTPTAPRTARAAAPTDVTGYWVSLITEDWRWRMIMPARGDYQSVPITQEAKRVADGWSPARDEAAGEQCRAYGAAGIMRMPTRLRVSWPDEDTLKVETDTGTQTRLLHFGAWKGGGRPSWQGDSVATWELPRRTEGDQAATGASKAGTLKVVTTNMRPGYLRKNGLPYSGNAKLTEYWDFHGGRNGEQFLVVSTIVEDPQYLQTPWMTSPNFKREPDGSKWDPSPCRAAR
jgi:hypothetical protein